MLQWHPMESVGQGRFRVAVVPARAAYLIRPRSRTGLRRAVQEASSRWAGATEPIIPVLSRGKVADGWRQVVELARVDGLVNVDVDTASASSAARELGLPVVPIKRIDDSGITRVTSHWSHIGAGLLREFVPCASTSVSSLWEVIAAGDLDEAHELDLAGSSNSIRRPATVDWVARSQLSGETLLDRTILGFAEHSGRGWMGPFPTIVWITKPNSFEDALWYWNLRALRPFNFEHTPMVLLPHRGPESWLGLSEQLADSLRRPAAIAPDVLVASISVSEDACRQIATEVLGLNEHDGEIKFSHRFPSPPLREPPFSYRVDLDARQFVAFERTYGRVADVHSQLYRDNTVVEFDNPVPFAHPAPTLVKIETDVLSHLPRRGGTAVLVHQHASWSTDGRLLLATNGSGRLSFTIRIPTADEATWTLLRGVDGGARISEKGQLGLRLQELDLSRLLVSPSVLAVIRSLQTPRSKELRKELEQYVAEGDRDQMDLIELAMTWGGRSERRHQSVSEISHPNQDATEAAERLASAGWLERGFGLECGSCRLFSFVALERVHTGPAVCPACQAAGAFRVTSTGPEMRYRLNPLVDRASDQGVVPHLQAIEILRSASPGTWLLPGVLLSATAPGLLAKAG